MKINNFNIFLLSVFGLLFLSSNTSNAQTEKHLRIELNQMSHAKLHHLETLGITLDCTGHFSEQSEKVVLEIPHAAVKKLKEASIPYKILLEDVSHFYQQRAVKDVNNIVDNYKSGEALSCNIPQYLTPSNFTLGSMGSFFTYQEMLQHLDQMKVLYPNLITSKTPITSSQTTEEGRAIYWFKISDNPDIDEQEPEVLYTALHHAREPMSMTQLIYYMYFLLENYATNQAIRDLVNHTELYFIPCINPDGYVYNETTKPNGGGLWRKNRRDNGDGTYGVDLNRNYGYNWGYDNTGSSPTTAYSTYRGTAPFSEAETQMVKTFCEAHEFRVCLNYHSYGNVLIYPWGYEADFYTADNDAFVAMSDRMNWYNRYRYGTTNETLNYLVNGDADDWMYGEEGTKNKILAMTPEVGKSSDGFWPSPSRILPLCQENIWPNLQTAYLVGNFAIIQDKNTTALSNINGTIDFGLQRLGLEDNEDFIVSIQAISNNVTFPSNSLSFTEMNYLETVDAAFSYELAPNIAAYDEVKYVINIHNGDFICKQDTFSKIYMPDVVFLDNFDDLNNWSVSPTNAWDLTTESAHNGDFSVTDSPNSLYPNNANKTLQLVNPIDLTDAVSANLSFWTKWDIDTYYDYAQVLASTDNGQNWVDLCGQYTKTASAYQQAGTAVYDGQHTDWLQENIVLDDFIGNHLLIKFVLKSNAATSKDGFYIDELSITKIPTPATHLKAKLFLEGAYNTTTGLAMRTLLKFNGFIPLKQPYTGSPWNYNGTEQVLSVNNIPPDIVDWVLVEARDAQDNEVVLETLAAFVNKNGDLISTNGAEGVFFKNISPNQDYFISIKHRNHIGVMSSTTINLPNNNTYDFTTASNKALGNNQMKEVIDVSGTTSVFVLHTGDMNGDGIINVADFAKYTNEINTSIATYSGADCSLNGNLTVHDFNLYQPNASVIGIRQLRY